jgi:hypothetical protein
MPNESSGPFLAAAVFCEKVLREGDGVLSAIRIVDRYTVSGQADEMPQAVISTTLLLILKAGVMRGKAKVRILPRTPSGEPLAEMAFDQLFEGDDRGIAIAAALNFPVTQEGLYWFDVAVEQQILTSMPLRILYQQQRFGIQ